MRTKITFFVILISSILVAQEVKPEFLKEGDKAPDFTIKTLDGKVFSTKELKGKTIYINFFATWCGPCMKEIPHVEKEIWQGIKNENFAMIAIGREHTVKEMEKFKTDKKLTMPIAADTKREVYSLFAPQNIPRNIIISKDGIVLWNKHGFEQDEFNEMIELIKKELK